MHTSTVDRFVRSEKRRSERVPQTVQYAIPFVLYFSWPRVRVCVVAGCGLVASSLREARQSQEMRRRIASYGPVGLERYALSPPQNDWRIA